MKKIIQIICATAMLLYVCVMATAAAGYFALPNEYSVAEGLAPDAGKLFRISGGDTPALSTTVESYDGELRLFGKVPIKAVKVSVRKRQKVAVCGSVFGLRMYTEGVNVVDLDRVFTADGERQPAFEAGFMKGDTIISVNGVEAAAVSDISDAVNACGGADLVFTVRRAQSDYQLTVTPAKDAESGAYKIGLWLRDSAAGIGTLTFYDPATQAFAGLGHSVCDADTGLPVEMRRGDILSATIHAVKKGANGTAGEITGIFGDMQLGEIHTNSDTGVYGVLTQTPAVYGEYEIAEPSEIAVGEAEMIASIDNDGPKAYALQVTALDQTAGDNRNMVIRVTDTRLLSVSGGIVQGMSGSPILQDGKLIGAVTHVLLDDSATGYAIFAKTMFESMCTSLTDSNAA